MTAIKKTSVKTSRTGRRDDPHHKKFSAPMTVLFCAAFVAGIMSCNAVAFSDENTPRYCSAAHWKTRFFAFVVPGSTGGAAASRRTTGSRRRNVETAVFSTNPNRQQRQPRRKLQKRRRRVKSGDGGANISGGGGGETTYESRSTSSRSPAAGDSFPWETAETRALVTAKSKELGEDYWIDQEELREAQEREKLLMKRRTRRSPDQVPDQKLWDEVLSPYKQNWIGYISVLMVVLATIVTKFPELLNTPVIPIPDI